MPSPPWVGPARASSGDADPAELGGKAGDLAPMPLLDGRGRRKSRPGYSSRKTSSHSWRKASRAASQVQRKPLATTAASSSVTMR